VAGKAQISTGTFSMGEKENFTTVLKAVNFLKKSVTPTVNFSDISNSGNQLKIYDSLLQCYFDMSYLKDSVKDASNKFEQQKAMQMLILYNIDHFLDILPADSIFISPLKYTALADQSVSYPENTLVVYYIINDTTFPRAVILFNKTGKLFAVSPLINFDSELRKTDIESFYERNRYSTIESKLWSP
jgi:hypothetical protein